MPYRVTFDQLDAGTGDAAKSEAPAGREDLAALLDCLVVLDVVYVEEEASCRTA